MNPEELQAILISHKIWLLDEDGGERANLQGADLQRADLQWANLQGANLQGANLQGANLREANLRGADLRRADMRRADLREADLREADLDYSSFPLWCGSIGLKCDQRLMAQLAYHFCRLDCPDELKSYQDAVRELAKQFHRFDECYGLPEPKEVSI